MSTPTPRSGPADRGGTCMVVGGTVAALVAADGIAAAGGRVRLLLPRRGVGGGFASSERGGRVLQQGMRVLELHVEDNEEAVDVRDYRPSEVGHRPFVHLVRAWLDALVGGTSVVAVDPPTTFLRGASGPEIYFSTDLSRARELVPPAVARAVAEEAVAVERLEGPAGLMSAVRRSGLGGVPFGEASVLQHGRTFHEEFLAPFMDKIHAGGSHRTSAQLRRKMWVPLFWPRTVAEAFSGAGIGFVPDRPLSVVRPGGSGRIVSTLLERLAASPLVAVERYDRVTGIGAGRGGAVRVRVDDGRAEDLVRPVLALATGELFTAAGIAWEPERVRSVLAWLEVAERDLLTLPGFVHVVDPAVDAYRISPGEVVPGGASRVVCVELSHDVERSRAGEVARDALVRTGIIGEGAVTTTVADFAAPTFTAPTTELVAAHAAALDAWCELGLDAEVVGGALALGSDALNEQVVQGLRVAALAG